MVRTIVLFAAKRRHRRGSHRVSALAAVTALVCSFAAAVVVVAGAVPAAADTAPLSGTPATVSADALPTWQVDGVVFSQVTVGNTVYATGNFGFARPPGTSVGDPAQVARGNLLAYDITTGNLVTSFNHSLNATGRSVTASPDGSRVYVAGDFTTVDGNPHLRVAAFDTASGNLVNSWAPSVNNTVRAVTATNSAVYVGGDFTAVNGNTATHLAALSATTGSLLAWNASANDTVTAMVMAPDQSRVVAAGRFTALDGTPYYGIGAVDASTGAGDPWTSTFPIKDAGPNSSITGLIADNTLVYGTAYDFGSGGNFEGRFAVDPYTGNLSWMDSCHGDSYSLALSGSVIYSASHAHDCSDGSSFDQMPNFARAQAETNYATGIAAHNNDTGNANYHDFGGQPTNTLLPWAPTLDPGTFTGEQQAAWSVTATSQYVAFGGEFPNVNGTPQEGLVRFAVSALAPNQVKPVSRSSLTPQASSVLAGTALVRWLGTYDQDNSSLMYKVFRDGGATPIYTTTAGSEFYQQPELSFLDTGLTPGTSHTYTIRVSDPFGNGFPSFASNSVVVAGSGTRTPYETAVTGDGATDFWPLSELSGTLVNDHIGGNDLSLLSISDVTRGAVGPTPAGTATATGFDGSSGGSGATIGGAVPLTDGSVEAWIKTTTGGGQIVDYGMSNSRGSAISTDTLYVDNGGKLHFAIWTNTGYREIGSANTVTDGQWHHVVGTMSGAEGAKLFIDGAQVAADASMTTTRQILGYWRIGGDRVDYLPSAPTNSFFTGAIADVAVYPKPLTSAQVSAHFAGIGVSNTAPTAGFTPTCSALHCSFDGTSSTDSDGTVADWAWTFGDGSSGHGPTPVHNYANPGTYSVTVTVTDNGGLTNSVTHTVTVAANQAPVASFTANCTSMTCTVDGTGSSDPDGPGVSYSWDFGDGTTANGATASHTYSVAGDYSVALTVSDSGSPPLTNTQTKTVVPRPPANATVLARDTFNRSVTGGLGTADIGGAWSTNYDPTTLAVTPGTGTLKLTQAPSSSGARLGSVSATDSDTTATMAIDKSPTGSGTFLYAIGRRINSTNEYRGRLRVAANGQLLVALTKLAGSSTESVISADTLIPGVTFTPGTQLKLRLQVVGTSPTTLRFKAWRASDTEPSSWQVTATDSTAALQQAGSVGLLAFMFGNSNNAPQTVSVTSFASAPSNTGPTAVAAASCVQLVCAADGTGSSGIGPLTYAWSFADGMTATGATPNHTYAQGGTYRITLTVTDAQGRTSVDTKSVTLNKPPVVSFTPTCNSGLTCAFDATGSADPDGSLTSTTWDFGDGNTASGLTASHTYAVGSTYSVTFSATDDGGATTTVTHPATVPPPNKPPTASFTISCTTMTCTVDGAGSSDQDGTVAGYSWDFGDGGTGSGVTASHTYAISGDYPVKLVVTDDQGATDRTTRTATVTPPPNSTLFASDTFQRTVSNGLGTADVGGAWTANNSATDLSVTPGAALLRMGSAPRTVGAALNGVSTTDIDVTTTVSLNKPGTGSGTFIYVQGRRISINHQEYRGRLKVLSSTEMLVSIQRLTASDATGTAIGADTLIPLRYAVGMQLNMHLQVTGTNPTSIRFNVWKSGTSEPSTWQVTATDSTAELQHAGSPGIASFLNSNSTNAPVVASVTSFVASRSQTPPTPSFTTACTMVAAGPRCSVDASASTDAQGISSYAWSFGDGATDVNTIPTSAHTYTASGTYRVTLTVTNSIGFTAVTTRNVTVEMPPVASFVGNCTGNTCTFDGTGSSDPGGPISGYGWDFGDGFNGSGAAVTHTFSVADTFSVTLTVTGHTGLTATTSKSFSFTTGNKPPTSAYIVTCQALSCTFDGTTSTDPDGTIANWAWDFGDGTTGTGQVATHTYAAASRVNTSLTVTDNGGATNTATYIVQTRAPNAPPTAAFSVSCVSGNSCTFDATGSTDSDGTVVNWVWDFGDGSSGSGQVATHAYANSNAVTVQLTVTDSDGATATTSQGASPTNNQPPVASFIVNCTGYTCAFDATGSTDPDGSITGYAWDYGDGNTDTGSTPSHTYAAAGNFTVRLTVTDGVGATNSTTKSATPTAPNAPPIASFSRSCNNLACSFDATASSDPDGSITGYAWDYGDGNTDTGSTPSHTFGGSGTYQVVLTVTDNSNATTSLTKSVTVVAADQSPVASFTSSCTGLQCSFDGSGSSDPDGNVASWSWSFGDTGTGSGSTASHTFAAAGDYSVTLTVTDNLGATNSTTTTVSPRPPANQTSLANDTFNRSVTGGWGNASSGQAWTPTFATSALSVTPAGGQLALGSAPQSAGARLASLQTSDADVSATMALDKKTTGGGVWLYLVGRRISSTLEYRARLKILPNGTATAALTMLNGSATETVIAPDTTIAGLTYTAGAKINLRFQAVGTSPTKLRFKVWMASDPEPANWQLALTDSTAALQAPGAPGVLAYAPSSVTNAPVVDTVSAFAVNRADQPPTAAVATSCSGLTCTVDGSGSSDAEGQIASYTWNYGDGVSVSGASATRTHTYGTAGTYRITLTVTDSSGFTNVTTKTVTVAQ